MVHGNVHHRTRVQAGTLFPCLKMNKERLCWWTDSSKLKGGSINIPLLLLLSSLAFTMAFLSGCGSVNPKHNHVKAGPTVTQVSSNHWDVWHGHRPSQLGHALLIIWSWQWEIRLLERTHRKQPWQQRFVVLCTQDADHSLSPRYTTDFLLSLGTRSAFEMRLALIQHLRRKEQPYKAVGFAPASVAHRDAEQVAEHRVRKWPLLQKLSQQQQQQQKKSNLLNTTLCMYSVMCANRFIPLIKPIRESKKIQDSQWAVPFTLKHPFFPSLYHPHD